MKLDKETVVKNRFWILVGTAAVLTLIGWLLLLFTAPATVAKERDTIEKSWKTLKNAGKDFKHPDYLAAVQAETKKLTDASSKSLNELYTTQISNSFMMTWPKAMVDDGFDFNNGKFADEIIVHKRDAKGDAKNEEKALKAQPQDTDNKISGIMVETEQNWIKIKDRKDRIVQIMRAHNTKITFREPVEKKGAFSAAPTFGDLSNKVNQVVEVTFKVGKWFGEELTEQELKKYRETYKDQLPAVLAEVGPINYFKEPVVLLRYITAGRAKKGAVSKDLSGDTWIYLADRPDRLPPDDNRFFSFVPSWPPDNRGISTEEVWTAQENLWVQRELYKQIRLTNESVAVAERSKDPKDSRDGWAKFRNFYWEIDLKVMDHGEKAKVAARVKNLRPQYQNVNNLRFLLRFKDPNDKDGKPSEPVVFPPKQPADLRFEGGLIDPADGANNTFPAKGKSPDYVEFPLAGPLAEVFSVEQILTVETAAVKRLDIVTVSVSSITGETALSHFDAGSPKFLTFKKKATPPPAATNVVVTDDPNAPPKIDAQPIQELQFDDPSAPKLDVGSKADLVKLSPNNLALDRYLQLNQGLFRTLPVCLVAVVGPEHLNRFGAALASSPLRFRTRQVLWQRCQLAVAGATPAAKTGPGAAGTGGIGEGQENIEMTIYGVLTLYDRPGRPPEPVAPPPKKK
jgi:hypothetical protein